MVKFEKNLYILKNSDSWSRQSVGKSFTLFSSNINFLDNNLNGQYTLNRKHKRSLYVKHKPIFYDFLNFLKKKEG